MGVLRRLLLAGSESRWLREHAPQVWFIRKAVRRFMPGEQAEDAFTAAVALRRQGIGAVLTQLGENVSDVASAEAVTAQYTGVLAASGAQGLDCHLSVKLTQLGLDVDEDRCYTNLRTLAWQARTDRRVVWVDMEQHRYVDRTLRLYRRLLAEFPNVGVCLQAYLYRTAEDLASLVPIGGGIRLVKGAYREPVRVAYPRKRDVDDNFLALAERMLAGDALARGLQPVFGTHDQRLIACIQDHVDATSVARDAFEFHLLFGVRRAAQARLAREGYRVRVLISYGEQWFPWYMRRLAERPANMLFVAKSMMSR